MQLIYLHGFNSNAEAGTFNFLGRHFRLVSAISYDYTDADASADQIEHFIEERLHVDAQTILVGTSLGGFWAKYFAQQFQLPYILVNPSVSPSVSLQKYIGENKNFKTGELRILTMDDCKSFAAYEAAFDAKQPCMVILGREDKVIDFEKTKQFFSGADIREIDAEHRIEDKEVLLPFFKEAITSFCNYFRTNNSKMTS